MTKEEKHYFMLRACLDGIKQIAIAESVGKVRHLTATVLWVCETIHKEERIPNTEETLAWAVKNTFYPGDQKPQ